MYICLLLCRLNAIFQITESQILHVLQSILILKKFVLIKWFEPQTYQSLSRSRNRLYIKLRLSTSSLIQPNLFVHIISYLVCASMHAYNTCIWIFLNLKPMPLIRYMSLFSILDCEEDLKLGEIICWLDFHVCYPFLCTVWDKDFDTALYPLELVINLEADMEICSCNKLLLNWNYLYMVNILFISSTRVMWVSFITDMMLLPG